MLQSECFSCEDSAVRNAYQWIAIVTMLIDHIGYLYEQPLFRAIGRLSMPLYCILFVMTIRKEQIHAHRLLILAILSQIPYMLYFDCFNLNIIAGFYIFYLMILAAKKRSFLWIPIVFGIMLIPVSYGWYLYLTLFVFYLPDNKAKQRIGFALITIVYCIVNHYPRQMLSLLSLFFDRIRLPRPNKYLYRYFFPTHLAILVIVKYLKLGVLTLPMVGVWSPGQFAPYDSFYDKQWNINLDEDYYNEDMNSLFLQEQYPFYSEDFSESTDD